MQNNADRNSKTIPINPVMGYKATKGSNIKTVFLTKLRGSGNFLIGGNASFL